MLKISVVFGLLAVVCWVICLFLLTQCISGFWGYPDVWKSEKARKAYMCLAPASFLFLIVSVFLVIIAL